MVEGRYDELCLILGDVYCGVWEGIAELFFKSVEDQLRRFVYQNENIIVNISRASEATVTVLAGGKANATGRGLSDISPKTRRP